MKPSAASDMRANTPPQPEALTATQQAAWSELDHAIRSSSLVLLHGACGSGKSVFSHRLVTLRQACRLDPRMLLVQQLPGRNRHEAADDAVLSMLRRALESHALVVFDDFDLVVDLLRGGGYGGPRPQLWAGALAALLDALRPGQCLVLIGQTFLEPYGRPGPISPLLWNRALRVTLAEPTAADAGLVLAQALGAARAEAIDGGALHADAGALNHHRLRSIGQRLGPAPSASQAEARAWIERFAKPSNSRLDQVEALDFDDLVGFEHIARQLSVHVLNALGNDARLAPLRLRPARGVLLYGPPGTGKTSVGRALAHRMKGRFFMIDGNVWTDPPENFYGMVDYIFEMAEQSVPAVLFIDDADVLFRSDRATGLTRYLLTKLDGMESATAGRVAVMMTAMDPTLLPAPVLRSGRIEIWLQTHPPTAEHRLAMLQGHLRDAPAVLSDANLTSVVDATEGCTPADLRRIVGDVCSLLAREVLAGRDVGDAQRLFDEAAAALADSRQQMAQALSGVLDAPAGR